MTNFAGLLHFVTFESIYIYVFKKTCLSFIWKSLLCLNSKTPWSSKTPLALTGSGSNKYCAGSSSSSLRALIKSVWASGATCWACSHGGYGWAGWSQACGSAMLQCSFSAGCGGWYLGTLPKFSPGRYAVLPPADYTSHYQPLLFRFLATRGLQCHFPSDVRKIHLGGGKK